MRWHWLEYVSQIAAMHAYADQWPSQLAQRLVSRDLSALSLTAVCRDHPITINCDSG